MRLVQRPRVEHRDLLDAEQVGVGAGTGHEAGVAGNEAADAGRELGDHTRNQLSAALHGPPLYRPRDRPARPVSPCQGPCIKFDGA